MATVSIVIPCYNAERYIGGCVRTLKAQTLEDLEFIFVDDGSSDKTASVLDSLKEEDERIVVIHQPNKGPGGARNTGILASHGDYVGFVDPDDTISENYFEALYNAAKTYDADIAWTNLLRCSKGKIPHHVVHFNKLKVYERIEDRPVLKSNHVVTKIYRRSLFDDRSLLFPEKMFYEDIAFSIPMMFSANRIVTVPDATYYYASDSDSITQRKQDAKLQEDRYKALLSVRTFLENKGLAVPRHLRQLRRKSYALGPVAILKVKDCGKYDVFKLFDLLPVWIKKNNV